MVFDVCSGCDGSDFAKAPSCEGAMLRGPERRSGIFKCHAGLAPQAVHHGVQRLDVLHLEGHAQLQMILQVLRQRRAGRAQRRCPCCCSKAPGPMPGDCRICGEPMAPRARSPAFGKNAVLRARTPRRCRCGPPAGAFTRQPVMTVRLGRLDAGRRKALVAFSARRCAGSSISIPRCCRRG